MCNCGNVTFGMNICISNKLQSYFTLISTIAFTGGGRDVYSFENVYRKAVFYGHNLQSYLKWIMADVCSVTVCFEIFFLPVSCCL